MDMICPPITAYRLHEALPDSKLNFVGAGGHGAWQSKIAEALSNEMELLKKQLQMNYGH
jgi:proline iminopeptidase